MPNTIMAKTNITRITVPIATLLFLLFLMGAAAAAGTIAAAAGCIGTADAFYALSFLLIDISGSTANDQTHHQKDHNICHKNSFSLA